MGTWHTKPIIMIIDLYIIESLAVVDICEEVGHEHRVVWLGLVWTCRRDY